MYRIKEYNGCFTIQKRCFPFFNWFTLNEDGYKYNSRRGDAKYFYTKESAEKKIKEWHAVPLKTKKDTKYHKVKPATPVCGFCGVDKLRTFGWFGKHHCFNTECLHFHNTSSMHTPPVKPPNGMPVYRNPPPPPIKKEVNIEPDFWKYDKEHSTQWEVNWSFNDESGTKKYDHRPSNLAIEAIAGEMFLSYLVHGSGRFRYTIKEIHFIAFSQEKTPPVTDDEAAKIKGEAFL